MGRAAFHDCDYTTTGAIKILAFGALFNIGVPGRVDIFPGRYLLFMREAAGDRPRGRPGNGSADGK
jgi:hypothetical protein